MELLLLPKSRTNEFVAALMRSYRLIAPLHRNEELLFAEIDAPEQVVLDYRNTVKAPKAVLFPQTECMIRFQRHLDQFNEIEAACLNGVPTVVLGIRPCDARSYLFMDRIFGLAPNAGPGQYLDPYYLARRENTLVFSLACDRPRQTCFCHAFDSGPYDRQGSDAFMRDADDAYLIEAVSDRGAAALQAIAALPGSPLAPADEAAIARAAEIEASAMARLSEMEPVAGIEAMLPALFDDPLWAEISEKCLACGTCTYNCPTCHCFFIEDRLFADSGERVRGWDSCMYPMFTQHASGHNPRPNQAARWRQRTMHKFEYLPRNVSLYGCVGCGRCVQSCPVRLDIRHVLRRVRQVYAAHGDHATEQAKVGEQK